MAEPERLGEILRRVLANLEEQYQNGARADAPCEDSRKSSARRPYAGRVDDGKKEMD